MKIYQNNPILVKVIIGVSTCLIAFYLILSICAAYFLSKPQRIFNSQAVKVFDFPPQDIQLKTNDGLIIKSWFISAPSSQKALILVHGMNSSRIYYLHDSYLAIILYHQNPFLKSIESLLDLY